MLLDVLLNACVQGIVDMIKFPILRILSGPLLGILGADLKHWCSPLIEFFLTLIMICVAWAGMSTIGAVYAAVRTRSTCARARRPPRRSAIHHFAQVPNLCAYTARAHPVPACAVILGVCVCCRFAAAASSPTASLGFSSSKPKRA